MGGSSSRPPAPMPPRGGAQQALGGLRVRDVMTREPVTTRPAGLTLRQFVDQIVWTRRHTTYPVTENGTAVGLLPFHRVAEVPRAEWAARRVRDDDPARGGARRRRGRRSDGRGRGALGEHRQPGARPRRRPAGRAPLRERRRPRARDARRRRAPLVARELREG